MLKDLRASGGAKSGHGLFRFGTYNLFNLELPRTTAQRARYELLVGVITEAYRGRPGVLAVQEILGDAPDAAAAILQRLADDTGMTCEATSNGWDAAPMPAIASSQHRFHVGMMWTPGVEPVTGGMRAYDGGPDFWHAMLAADFDCGGPAPIRWVSYHADPFRPHKRFDEAHRVMSVFQDEHVQGGVGADWNEISADRRPNGEYYDADPYSHQSHRLLRYQVRFDPEHPDAPAVADRSATRFLRQDPGGLRDTAAVLDAPWEPSCGHWVSEDGRRDVWGPRRIDTTRTTVELAAVARTHITHSGPKAEQASDHFMVTSDFELEAMA